MFNAGLQIHVYRKGCLPCHFLACSLLTRQHVPQMPDWLKPNWYQVNPCDVYIYIYTHGIPPCLWRCALPTTDCSLAVKNQRAIMLYLLKVTQVSTIANVDDYHTTESVCLSWNQENPIDWPIYAD